VLIIAADIDGNFDCDKAILKKAGTGPRSAQGARP
jgi:hypothetical protein